MSNSTVPPVEAIDDCTTSQEWHAYSTDEHTIWRTLFNRQTAHLENRAADDYFAGIEALGRASDDGIPDFARLSEALWRATKWQIVPVAGLIPDDSFFNHLAHRRFPATTSIRTWEQIDYLQEPDVFHDVFGHVPMLFHPVFADYLQAYGRGGLKALRLGSLDKLARLYWYTVEFGLIRTDQGLRIYGSGIVSSKGESIYALENPKPRRVAFDLMRIMRTRYRIDDFQDIYFVIDNYEQLFDETRPDFTPYYEELGTLSELVPGEIIAGDQCLPPNPPAAPAN